MDNAQRPSRFPALDQEPPPTPIAKRLLWLAVAVVIILASAGALAGVRSLISGKVGSTPTAPGSVVPAGGIVFWSSKWIAIGVATPDAKHMRQVSATIPDLGGLLSGWASPDGRTLLIPNGEALELTGSAQAQPHGIVSPTVLRSWQLVEQPWVDSGRRLLLAQPSAAGSGTMLSSADIATGALSTIGTMTLAPFAPDYGNFLPIWNHRILGDPIGSGAAAVIAAPHGASSVALMSLGKDPAILISDRVLAAVAGIPSGQPVGLSLIGFSRSGQLLAVFGWQIVNVNQAQGSGAPLVNRWAVAVVDRTGRLVATLPGDRAVTVETAVWASENTLVMLVGHGGLATLLWQVGGTSRLVSAPAPPRGGYSPTCLSAPDGSSVLCGDASGWLSINASTGASTYYGNVPGPPLAWVPEAPR